MKYRVYDGLMSRPRKYKNRIRNKLGYFDFYIDVSGRYGDKQVTHRELIIDLLRNSKLQNCIRVWNGENIECITNNLQEQKVLYVLALFMIEQDINWGYKNGKQILILILDQEIC